MTTKKEETRMEKLKGIDWLGKGVSIFTLIATAYVSGYVSTVAAEHRSARRARKLAQDSDSNVLSLDRNKRAANN